MSEKNKFTRAEEVFEKGLEIKEMIDEFSLNEKAKILSLLIVDIQVHEFDEFISRLFGMTMNAFINFKTNPHSIPTKTH